MRHLVHSAVIQTKVVRKKKKQLTSIRHIQDIIKKKSSALFFPSSSFHISLRLNLILTTTLVF